ncbi:hypothetical protein FRC06_001113 [Ceratobasidium sp. 370]|nr:hypothetical protein FRC06_001113 [Ceratobasidium sp. 370]
MSSVSSTSSMSSSGGPSLWSRQSWSPSASTDSIPTDLSESFGKVDLPASSLKWLLRDYLPRKRKAEVLPVDAPRRQSRRLRSGATPANFNETKAQREKREAEEREAEEEAKRFLEAERVAKMPRHEDLELETLAKDFEESELETWKTLQASLVAEKYPRHIGSLDLDTEEAKMERAREELSKELKKLAVTSRAKERIYSVAYHPTITKDVVLFGDKSGSLGIWDARAALDEHEGDEEETRDTAEGGQYWRLQPHWPQTSKSSISAIKIDPRDGHTVFTASYDGTLRSTSFVTGISTELVATEEHLLSSFDLSQDGRGLWISDSGGGLQHVDTRERSLTRRWELTEKEKIGCVSVNPVLPHLLLTASNNRTLRMWDSRYLKKVDISNVQSDSGDDRALESTWEDVQHYLDTKNGPRCLWGEWQHRQSVSSAFWDVTGRRIVSTSYDDTLRIWDIRPNALKADGPLGSFRPAHEIKHNWAMGYYTQSALVRQPGRLSALYCGQYPFPILDTITYLESRLEIWRSLWTSLDAMDKSW